MPPNFSAVYAMMFCAGVFFPRRLVWWLPLATLLVTDLCLNVYYHSRYGSAYFSFQMVGNYTAYLALIGLGRWFGPKASFLSLLGGGLLGAILFYIVTNSISWLDNSEYAKTFMGWITALTKGTNGYPPTFEFFRNSLTSGGLFTALFAGAMKLMEAPEPEVKEEEKPEIEHEPESETEEAKA